MLWQDCTPFVKPMLKQSRSQQREITGQHWMSLYCMIFGKGEGDRTNLGFVVAIEAFGRMGGLSHAEQLWLEMKSKKGLKSTKQFNSMISEALKTLDLGNDLSASTRIRKSTPWLEITLSINAEKLFEELKKANYTRYTFVYNTLIKAYVKAKIYDPNLLKRMILGGSRPDSKTYSLFKLIEQFRA
ncbi:hypothetical protein CsSME_00010679 [Camellia sinensis var. sinensis]